MDEDTPPRNEAREATILIAWTYDHQLLHAAAVKVAYPSKLRAIAAAKKKNERIDATRFADLLRGDLLKERYMVFEERFAIGSANYVRTRTCRTRPTFLKPLVNTVIRGAGDGGITGSEGKNAKN